jgi:Phytanoyl-CoA dioxygenase (PhyH)
MTVQIAAPRPLFDGLHKRAMRDDGFALFPGLVPRPLVDAALRAINTSLGHEGMAKDDLPRFRARTFTPELCATPPILDLFTASPLRTVAEAAIGPGNLRLPGEGQVALRFPTAGPGSSAVPHIDGVASPGNGVPPGTLFHFTALAAVFLSDVDGDDRGNFTVWPGSHRRLEEHFRTHGPTSIVERFPDLPLGPPRQIRARAGDAVLAHYALAHGIAPNLGPHVRYAVFFRLYHTTHDQHGSQPLTDLWFEWQGMRNVTY